MVFIEIIPNEYILLPDITKGFDHASGVLDLKCYM